MEKININEKLDSEDETIPVTAKDIFEVKSLLNMPLATLQTIPVTRITEAMYILDRISPEDKNKIFFSQDLPKEKLEIINRAHRYILEVGTANESGIIHGAGIIDLKE